jgi:hypothetical protein
MEALFPGSSQAQRRFPVEVTGLGTDGKAAGLGAATVRGWEVEQPAARRAGAASGTGRHQLRLFRGHGVDSGARRSSARANLFAVEAYTFDRPVRYHLDYQTLRTHLGEIRARRIVLTHMSGAITRLADADLPAAYDGMTADL